MVKTCVLWLAQFTYQGQKPSLLTVNGCSTLPDSGLFQTVSASQLQSQL